MITTSFSTKTVATTNAVTTVEAKNHLRVDFAAADDNTYIDSLVVSAQRQVEAFTNLVLNDTTFYFKLSAFPANGIVLPFSPLKTLTSIKYYDSDNSQQTLANTEYYYDINEKPNVIRYVNSPPSTYDYRGDAVIVEFVVGYTTPDIIPPGLEHAIKLLLTDLYEHRTDLPREKFSAWKSLAYPYRVFHSTSENK